MAEDTARKDCELAMKTSDLFQNGNRRHGDSAATKQLVQMCFVIGSYAVVTTSATSSLDKYDTLMRDYRGSFMESCAWNISRCSWAINSPLISSCLSSILPIQHGDFNKVRLVLTITALEIAIMATKPMMRLREH
ncbi:hypothetical protein BDR04DRAFT_1112813 [Suillus decipiens]|nr:hypothetical protein BDR04DRAFT_1112813 [Suillus decipiens]